MNGKIKPAETGQALVILAIGFVVLVGFTALAIDGGMVYADRRQAQNAADSAALSAALAKLNDQSWYMAGLDRANSNGYDNNGTTNTVDIFNPPISGQYAGDDEYLQVLITADVNTALIHFVFQGDMQNTVEAVARAIPSQRGEFYNGYAIVGLKPTGTKAIWKHGNADTEVTGGGIWSNSNDANRSFEYNGAAGNLTVHAPADIAVVGGARYSGGTPNATVNTGQLQFAYPPLIEVPSPTCSGNAVWDSVSHTLSPGNWTGDFPPDRETYLSPGEYCLTDTSFRANANNILSGSDILLYFVNGTNITWNGNAEINLSGRESGPFEGMVIYIDHQNYSNPGGCNAKINGNEHSEFVGTIYAPTCNVKMLGAGETTGWRSQVIGYSVELGGNNDLDIFYSSDDNYVATKPPQIELTK
jgi:hypothetical protein